MYCTKISRQHICGVAKVLQQNNYQQQQQLVRRINPIANFGAFQTTVSESTEHKCRLTRKTPQWLEFQTVHTSTFPSNSNKNAITSSSSSAANIDTNEEFNDELQYEIDDELDETKVSTKMHQILYEDESDDIMKELNTSKDHKELLANMIKNTDVMSREHCAQCVILLWTLWSSVEYKSNPHNDVLAAYEKMVSLLQPHIPQMNANELSCCYLYLRKMNVPNTHATLEAVLMRALDVIASPVGEQPISLTALSRLAVGINGSHDYHTPTVCANFMPHIVAHVSDCQNENDARLLAICMLNLQPLIDMQLLTRFKSRIHELLDGGVINAQTPRTITKLLHMLNMMSWSQHNTQLIRDLLLTLRPQIEHLADSDLPSICRLFSHHLEPAGIVEPLKCAIKAMLHTNENADTLACYIPFSEPCKREPLVAAFKRMLTQAEYWQSPKASSNFFTTLRGLKISDTKVCDTYWTHVLDDLNAIPEQRTQLHFLSHCHRYMNFNNNLGGTYRYLPLERRLSQFAMHAIEGDVAGRIPSRFARLASFVLAYGHTQNDWRKFPNVILSRILSMAEQFSVADCAAISRGLQIALEMRFRHHVPSLLGMQLATIDSVLLECAERHLTSSEPLSVGDLNAIVRALSTRKTFKNSQTYHKAFEKYKEINCKELNSRAIREMAYNFISSNFFIPQMLEAMFDYIEHNYEHIVGDTVEKVLSSAYHLGYTPKSQDVLDYAAAIILRDFNHMSGLAIVQACLALCYYKRIPEELINKVFCVKFIQHIEDEIQMCYSKATYPERVLNLVMQLNRTVCLDFPEANVPWFQQNYLEAQITKKHVVRGNFSDEVKQLLEELLKDKTYFRCNHTTPYGYQIDFVIHFDRDKKPITPTPVETTMLDRITKVAILLLKLDSFCENDLTTLRGPDSLKMKHLEMMGYRVLHINEHDWNTKYMNIPGNKTNYLKCMLQITN